MGHARERRQHVALAAWRVESSAAEVSAIPRQLDLRVHDIVALDEIDLYTDVLSAVAAADRPLTDAEIDEVLGITEN
jgi:hypothetical protein